MKKAIKIDKSNLKIAIAKMTLEIISIVPPPLHWTAEIVLSYI